ncbi:MAG: DUF5670 family protein [Terriglobales bacterium]
MDREATPALRSIRSWISGFAVFHVAGALIHLLLVFAVISLILYFVIGGARTVRNTPPSLPKQEKEKTAASKGRRFPNTALVRLLLTGFADHL